MLKRLALLATIVSCSSRNPPPAQEARDGFPVKTSASSTTTALAKK